METLTSTQKNNDWHHLLLELLDDNDPRFFSAAARYITEVVPAARLKNYLLWLNKIS